MTHQYKIGDNVKARVTIKHVTDSVYDVVDDVKITNTDTSQNGEPIYRGVFKYKNKDKSSWFNESDIIGLMYAKGGSLKSEYGLISDSIVKLWWQKAKSSDATLSGIKKYVKDNSDKIEGYASFDSDQLNLLIDDICEYLWNKNAKSEAEAMRWIVVHEKFLNDKFYSKVKKFSKGGSVEESWNIVEQRPIPVTTRKTNSGKIEIVVAPMTMKYDTFLRLGDNLNLNAEEVKYTRRMYPNDARMYAKLKYMNDVINGVYDYKNGACYFVAGSEKDFKNWLSLHKEIVVFDKIDKNKFSKGDFLDFGNETTEELRTLKLERSRLYSKAFKTFPNSPSQLKVRKQIDLINKKIKDIEGEPVKFSKGNSLSNKKNDKMKNPKVVATKNNIEKLSHEFSNVLKKWLGVRKIKEIVRRNATPEYSGNCASHDFCDANQAMLEGFEKVVAREYIFFNSDVPGSEKQNEYDTDLWNEAWEMAKENKFYPEEKKYAKGGSVSNDARIYVADLAAYNEGSLIGEWLELSDYSTGSDVMDAIQELLDKWSEEAGVKREEYAIYDTDNFPDSLYSEYMGADTFDKFYAIMEVAEDRDIPVDVIVEWMSDHSVDDPESISDAYQGEYDDMEDFAYRMIEDGVMTDLTSYLEITDTDRRIIAGEESDSIVEDMDDDDMIRDADMEDELEELDNKNSRREELESEIEDKQAEIDDLNDEVEELTTKSEDDDLSEEEKEDAVAELTDKQEELDNKTSELEELQNEFSSLDDFDYDQKKSDLAEEAKEKIRDDKYTEIYDSLADPVSYFVEEQGIYTAEELAKQSFIRIDYEAVARDLSHDYSAIEHDGKTYVFSDNYRRGGKLKSSKKYSHGGSLPAFNFSGMADWELRARLETFRKEKAIGNYDERTEEAAMAVMSEINKRQGEFLSKHLKNSLQLVKDGRWIKVHAKALGTFPERDLWLKWDDKNFVFGLYIRKGGNRLASASEKEVLTNIENGIYTIKESDNYKSGGRTKAAIAADKNVKALHPGKRVSESGNQYYESRPNRSDVNRIKKFADGGGVGDRHKYYVLAFATESDRKNKKPVDLTKEKTDLDTAKQKQETLIESGKYHSVGIFAVKDNREVSIGFYQQGGSVNRPNVGDVFYDTKKNENAIVVKVSKPAKGSALEAEPFLVDFKYDNGKKAINFPIDDRFKKKNEFADGGNVESDDLKKEIEEIIKNNLPGFWHSVSKYRGFGADNLLAIKIAAKDYDINNVTGQKPQAVSLSLDVNTMELQPQMYGGNGGKRIYREPDTSVDKEKYLAMKGIDIPFRTPPKNKVSVLKAIDKFTQNYKKLLQDNINTLKYQDIVDYQKLLKGEFAKGGRVRDVELPGTNLWLHGFGLDTNGNYTVKVGFPNSRAFSIQTNGVLPGTQNIGKSSLKISDISKSDLQKISNEVFEYVSKHGSLDQKKRVKKYSSSEEKFSGGGLIGYMEKQAEKIINHYLPGVEPNEVSQREFENIGDYSIDTDIQGDGSKNVFINVYFGDKYKQEDEKITKDYKAYASFLEGLADKKRYYAEVNTVEEDEVVSYKFWNPRTAKY